MTDQPPLAKAAPSSALDALKGAGDIIKLSTSLATGALVFSVGLLGGAAGYAPWTRRLLAVTWCLLFLSIATGVISQAAIPVLMSEEKYDIEAPTYTWPGRAHQALFLAGLLLLAVALVKILYAEPAEERLRVRTAAEAVQVARATLAPRDRVSKLDTVELIKGTDQSSGGQMTWHVQLELAPTASEANAAPHY
ncbi:MAG: hypothetical protein JO157_05530, partial [Acetobacteraceae bacterium]|nr:hypothetical protein [Acetobacteraceae bacterium]